MAQTPREIVTRCLRFDSPERVPRDLWVLPWARLHCADGLSEIHRKFHFDFGYAPRICKPSPRLSGNAFEAGRFVDEWGAVFENIQPGIHGEVRTPMLCDLSEWQSVSPPYEIFPDDWDAARDTVNAACAGSDQFMLPGCLPRPWERLQFLCGTEEAMLGIMEPEEGAGDLLSVIHEFYMKELEFWVTTDVDAIFFMDDWGSQRSLLIPPPVWRDLFKPLYRDYCELAHRHGKFVFMHSDGYIADIYEDLIEIGVDAVNSQLFCMDIPELARRYKGRITFWGEIDRQHVLTSKDPARARSAVRKVAEHLYDPKGGVIAQCEFGAGAVAETVSAVFDEWGRVEVERFDTAQK